MRDKAANKISDETSAKNPEFRKVYEAYRAFRNEEYLQFQVGEYPYDNFMICARAGLRRERTPSVTGHASPWRVHRGRCAGELSESFFPTVL